MFTRSTRSAHAHAHARRIIAAATTTALTALLLAIGPAGTPAQARPARGELPRMGACITTQAVKIGPKTFIVVTPINCNA